MSAERTVDMVVLGGGSGRYACVLRAVEMGLSVVLLEKDALGGTCLHRGCIPTKALLHAAEVTDHTGGAAKVGVLAELTGVDMPAVLSAEVTIVEALPRLAPRKEEFASTPLERAFRRRGITTRTGPVLRRPKELTDTVTVSLDCGEELEAHLLLVAVGRGPNTTGHGYEVSDLAMNRGFVTVESRLHPHVRGSRAVTRGLVNPAVKDGRLDAELATVSVPQRKGDPVQVTGTPTPQQPLHGYESWDVYRHREPTVCQRPVGAGNCSAVHGLGVQAPRRSWGEGLVERRGHRPRPPAGVLRGPHQGHVGQPAPS